MKQLQEEYGGAGKFFIPFEEHYQLEKEEWRYDKFPEFFNGSNVLDFYDPDIEEKLAALEKEEEEILKMEADENAVMDGEESENSDGINYSDLKRSLKQVRNDKAIIKLNSKMKSKQRITPKIVKTSDIIKKMESKGIEVNKESLRSRSKTRRSIADLEGAADRLAAAALDSDGNEEDIVMDDDIAKEEAEQRGRNKDRKRKRTKSIDSDDLMEVDEGEAGEEVKKEKTGRSLTPAQLKISVKKQIRSKSKDRREGSEPKRLPYKLVPEEQIRLAKKINKRFKHVVNINEADRAISVKKPKHLFAGKMSNGARNKR